MTKTIYHVDSWQALFALPEFEKTALHRDVITKGHLVGDYEMAPKEGLRPCGILKCETNHRHGFIVKTTDGRLSHVGRDCGKAHFGASWSQVRKALSTAKQQISREKAVTELKDAIRFEIGRWPSFDTPHILSGRKILTNFDGLPSALRAALESRAQQGDTSVPDWRDPTEKEKQQAKFYGQKDLRRVRIERGPLGGLRAVNPKNRLDFLIDRQGPRLVEEANSLVERRDASSGELNTMLHRLSAFPASVESSLKQLHVFLDEATSNP